MTFRRLDANESSRHGHERRNGNQVFLKLYIVLFLMSGIAIGILLSSLTYVPVFGWPWE